MSALMRLFGEGFRFFFLAAGLYAVFLLLVWEMWIGIHAIGGMAGAMPFAAPPHLWHAHEMVFGYAVAAIAGFLLTAVPNWTGAPAAGRGFVTLAAMVWLAGRLAVWFSASLPPALVAVADLAFLPLLAGLVAVQLRRRPKPANVMFVGILMMLWVANLMVHLEWLGLADTLWAGTRGGLLGICAMIAVLGGRVTPAFTRNALKGKVPPPVSRKPAEVAGVTSAILLPPAYLAALPETVTGALALLAGLAALARLSGWRGRHTLGRPILWALHLAFLMLGLGYLALAASAFGGASEVAALHVLGIGAAGGMTLAVMSRATLGHSGRPLVAPGSVAWAYGLVGTAAVLRWLGSELPIGWYYAMVLGSGAVWILAFTMFVATLWPAFWGPRAEAGDA